MPESPFRPVTIEDTRVVTHEAATTNSGSVGSSVGDDNATNRAIAAIVTALAPTAGPSSREGYAAVRDIQRMMRDLRSRLAAAEAALADRDRHFAWDDRLRMEREIGTLVTRLATAEAERDRLRELGGDHLITALAFLAGHHDRKRAEAADAIHSRVTDEEIANCERHVAHHTEQLYQIGELTALLGGRNAYPRRAPSTGTTPP